jgi:hypothetical protein
LNYFFLQLTSFKAIGKYEEALNSMPTNKETLVHCAISWYRLLLIRGEHEGWHDQYGVYLETHDPDVQKMNEYIHIAIHSDPSDPQILCLYAQFMEKQRNFAAAESKSYFIFSYYNLFLLLFLLLSHLSSSLNTLITQNIT